eukprot:Rhum_TRINITY_DN18656_c0_g1::Rhum_TRINITY_DN18656_c0_g1_i1::g.168014::m.168014
MRVLLDGNELRLQVVRRARVPVGLHHVRVHVHAVPQPVGKIGDRRKGPSERGNVDLLRSDLQGSFVEICPEAHLDQGAGVGLPQVSEEALFVAVEIEELRARRRRGVVEPVPVLKVADLHVVAVLRYVVVGGGVGRVRRALAEVRVGEVDGDADVRCSQLCARNVDDLLGEPCPPRGAVSVLVGAGVHRLHDEVVHKALSAEQQVDAFATRGFDALARGLVLLLDDVDVCLPRLVRRADRDAELRQREEVRRAPAFGRLRLDRRSVARRDGRAGGHPGRLARVEELHGELVRRSLLFEELEQQPQLLLLRVRLDHRAARRPRSRAVHRERLGDGEPAVAGPLPVELAHRVGDAAGLGVVAHARHGGDGDAVLQLQVALLQRLHERPVLEGTLGILGHMLHGPFATVLPLEKRHVRPLGEGFNLHPLSPLSSILISSDAHRHELNEVQIL